MPLAQAVFCKLKYPVVHHLDSYRFVLQGNHVGFEGFVPFMMMDTYQGLVGRRDGYQI